MQNATTWCPALRVCPSTCLRITRVQRNAAPIVHSTIFRHWKRCLHPLLVPVSGFIFHICLSRTRTSCADLEEDPLPTPANLTTWISLPSSPSRKLNTYSSVALNFMICLVCFFNLLSQNGLYEYLDRFDQY